MYRDLNKFKLKVEVIIKLQIYEKPSRWPDNHERDLLYARCKEMDLIHQA
jgi:hypothetical protein